MTLQDNYNCVLYLLSFFFFSYPRGILRRAPTVGSTFKFVPQPRLKVPVRTERHRFSKQRRLPCDSNWGANPVKPLKGLNCQWSEHFVGNECNNLDTALNVYSSRIAWYWWQVSILELLCSRNSSLTKFPFS